MKKPRPFTLDTNQFHDLLHEMRQMLINPGGALYRGYTAWNTKWIADLDRYLAEMQTSTLKVQAEWQKDLDRLKFEEEAEKRKRDQA